MENYINDVRLAISRAICMPDLKPRYHRRMVEILDRLDKGQSLKGVHRAMAKTLVQALEKEDRHQDREAELAIALARYIDPSDPEFDPNFTKEIMERNPGWFTEFEIQRFQAFLAENGEA